MHARGRVEGPGRARMYRCTAAGHAVRHNVAASPRRAPLSPHTSHHYANNHPSHPRHQGDAQSVLDAIDAFSAYYPMYKIGPEKGALLEGVLAQRPGITTALELGSFLGYSAIRIARRLPPPERGGMLVCIEANPDCAAVVRELCDFAGVGGTVSVLHALAAEALPAAAAQLLGGGGSSSSGVGLLFLDHCKDCYLPDLKSAEAMGLVGLGSVVVADNVKYPGRCGKWG